MDKEDEYFPDIPTIYGFFSGCFELLAAQTFWCTTKSGAINNNAINLTICLMCLSYFLIAPPVFANFA